MARLGKYSGNIYEENEVDIIEECATIISDEQAKNEDFIKKHHANDLANCVKCCGCPMAKKGVIDTTI